MLYQTELPTACGRQDWIRTNDTKFPKFKSKLLYASFLNFNRNALRFRALPLSYISYLSKIWLDSNQQPLLNRQFVINYFAVCIPLLIFFKVRFLYTGYLLYIIEPKSIALFNIFAVCILYFIIL